MWTISARAVDGFVGCGLDMVWGGQESRQFVTNVGLVTTDGPHGRNIMTCEWSHHISYRPGLLAVCVGPRDATHDNIESTRQFGVGLASVDQTVLSSLAGGYTGKEFDKVAALQELGFKFRDAQEIMVPMVEGTALSMECRLTDQRGFGDHTMFVGEILVALADAARVPLIYHQGRYGRAVLDLPKPSDDERKHYGAVFSKHRKHDS